MRSGRNGPARPDPWLTEVRANCERAEQVSEGLFATDLVGPDGSRGFDPTGVAKGWAVQRASERLSAVPAITFCLNAGGDLTCGSGPHSDALDPTWRVGIEDPRDAGSITTIITVRDGALATSGTGRRGAHLVDPRTGLPASGAHTSVTVTGPELTWCDVWATVCFLDPEALSRAGSDWSSYRLAWTTP